MTREPGLVDVVETTFDTLPCCGIKDPTHPGRLQKRCWLQANANLGVRAKTLLTPDGKPTGYIEYLPGEFAWRGVEACGYMLIHCIWNHASRHQRRGWGSVMIQACIDDAKRSGMSGVAVVVRDGPWLAGAPIFLANGFEQVDTAPPDYRLLIRKLKDSAAAPAFKKDWDRKPARYGSGLTMIRSGQCPYVAKFAGEIAETAVREYHLQPKIVELKSWRDAQNAPTPYAVFALVYNGRVLADHQISRTRFRNIMNHLAGGKS